MKIWLNVTCFKTWSLSVTESGRIQWQELCIGAKLNEQFPIEEKEKWKERVSETS